MKLRSTVVTAAVSAAAALTATGITYASAASAPASQQAPALAAPAPQAAPAAPAPRGGSGGGNNNSKGNEGNEGNDNGNNGNKGNKGNKGNNRGDEGYNDNEGGNRIQINERSYSARRGECVTVLSDLGAKSLNIRNDTRKIVEVFRGAVCDNGSPIATVGPHSSAYGVHPGHVDGVHIHNGVVASFRVIKHHRDDD